MCGGASLVVIGGVMVAGAVAIGGMSFAEGTGLRAVRALRRKRKIQEAAQVEKVSYETAQTLLETFGKVTSVGPSLGSFSLSNEMLMALLTEFAADLASKQAKMDSDPHFWMPLTLAKDAYVSVMVTKVRVYFNSRMGNSYDVFFSTQDETAEVAAAHHDRMQALCAKLPTNRGVFGAIDVGEGCYWWDYGQLKLYLTNNVLAMNESEEAAGKFLSFNASMGN